MFWGVIWGSPRSEDVPFGRSYVLPGSAFPSSVWRMGPRDQDHEGISLRRGVDGVVLDVVRSATEPASDGGAHRVCSFTMNLDPKMPGSDSAVGATAPAAAAAYPAARTQELIAKPPGPTRRCGRAAAEDAGPLGDLLPAAPQGPEPAVTLRGQLGGLLRLVLLWCRNSGRCDRFHAANPSRAVVTCSVTALSMVARARRSSGDAGGTSAAQSNGRRTRSWTLVKKTAALIPSGVTT